MCCNRYLYCTVSVHLTKHPSSNHFFNSSWLMSTYVSYQLESCFMSMSLVHPLPQRWDDYLLPPFMSIGVPSLKSQFLHTVSPVKKTVDTVKNLPRFQMAASNTSHQMLRCQAVLNKRLLPEIVL